LLQGNVLITGGTGSLGTAILERATKENWPAEFTVIARNETKLSLTKQRFPEVRCEIGDIREVSRLATLFHRQDIIIHAAAIKIVPVAEASPTEAIRTNVIGSINVARVAQAAKVQRVIGISTDKVCGPTYYGITKRLMEAVFREANSQDSTEFVLCRYGNVLRSNNSIVPLFEKQIAEDKPFTVTDLRMTRFWLSMQMAIDLILDTLQNARPGEIYVPMAPTMKLVDLAHTLDPDRVIEVIGIRPGERLHETLIVREEAQHTLKYPDGKFVIHPPNIIREPLLDSGIQRLPDQYEYTSEDTSCYLTPEKMRNMLAES
jgi:UDP-N-acetylglucosamine 4,6-dehydratase/5-epimerase